MLVCTDFSLQSLSWSISASALGMKVRSERRDAAAASLSSACSFCSFLLAWASANSTSYLTSRAAACIVSTRGRSSP